MGLRGGDQHIKIGPLAVRERCAGCHDYLSGGSGPLDGFRSGMSRRYGGVERLGAACRELGASGVGPGAAFSSRRPDRGRSSEGEGGVNLGDSGPDSGVLLPVFPFARIDEGCITRGPTVL